MRVAGADGQRTADVAAIEALARGERLRIGYQPGDHRYLLSLSIDDRGEVTPLYPERGPSLTVPDGSHSATRFLPDSLELTGKGTERIIVVLSDQPIDVEAARRAARAAYQKAGRQPGAHAHPRAAGRAVRADVRQAVRAEMSRAPLPSSRCSRSSPE